MIKLILKSGWINYLERKECLNEFNFTKQSKTKAEESHEKWTVFRYNHYIAAAITTTLYGLQPLHCSDYNHYIVATTATTL